MLADRRPLRAAPSGAMLLARHVTLAVRGAARPFLATARGAHTRVAAVVPRCNHGGVSRCIAVSLGPSRNAPTAQMFEMENKEKHRANLAGNSAIVATPTVNASVKLNPLTKVNAMLHEMRSRSRLCKADMVSFAALVVYSAALDAAFALMSYAELA